MWTKVHTTRRWPWRTVQVGLFSLTQAASCFSHGELVSLAPLSGARHSFRSSALVSAWKGRPTIKLAARGELAEADGPSSVDFGCTASATFTEPLGRARTSRSSRSRRSYGSRNVLITGNQFVKNTLWEIGQQELPSTQYPVPSAQCPVPSAQCPVPSP